VGQDRSPRRDFRVLTRHRGGYDGELVDVQLQVAETGSIVWAQTFSAREQADEFQAQLETDLDTLDDAAFRRKYSVPSNA
jgi:hypothetical protein